MSVLIEGLLSPLRCNDCRFNNGSKCILLDGCDYDETNGCERRKNCPVHHVTQDEENLIFSARAFYSTKGCMFDIGDYTTKEIMRENPSCWPILLRNRNISWRANPEYYKYVIKEEIEDLLALIGGEDER